MWIIVELVIAILFASIGQLFWKLGMNKLGPISNYDLCTIGNVFINLQVDIGILFYAVGTIFWLIALSKKDLSYVYPFIAGTYIIVLILSYFIIGEKFGLYRFAGAIVVLLGLLLVIKGN